MLHSFYTGIEFIMRSVADGFAEGPLTTGSWHAALLDNMRQSNIRRPALLSGSTADQLKKYMLFRHRFRNLYSFDLDWAMMKPLAASVAEMLRAFELDLDRFLASARAG